MDQVCFTLQQICDTSTKHFSFVSKFSPKKCVFGCQGKLADYGSMDAVCFSGLGTES